MNWRAWILLVWFLFGLSGVLTALGIIFDWWQLEGITRRESWGMLSASLTWILAVGVVFAIWQINQAKKSTNAQIAMDLFRELRSDRALGILRFIYNLKPAQGKLNLPSTDLHSIDYILDRFDVLSVLVAEKCVDDKLAIDAYAGVSALACPHKGYHFLC